MVGMWKKDYEWWGREADMALSLNPNYALAINVRGLVHIYTGEPTKALPYIEHAIRLDPPNNCIGISWRCLFRGG